MIDLVSGEHVEMEQPAPGEPVVAIGPYTFSQAAFDWAHGRLLAPPPIRGPGIWWSTRSALLELRGEALAPAMDALLARPHLPELVVVVRDSLRDTVAARFDLSWEAFPPA
jgi:hypothetical protein